MYNVAVLQLKEKLVFDHKSPYLPICLPPRCDGEHDCRSRDGNIKRDLIGTRTVTSIGSYRSLPGLKIITNGECNFANYVNYVISTGPDSTRIFKIRRYIITFTLCMKKSLVQRHHRDHLCTEKYPTSSNSDCKGQSKGAPLSIAENDSR